MKILKSQLQKLVTEAVFNDGVVYLLIDGDTDYFYGAYTNKSTLKKAIGDASKKQKKNNLGYFQLELNPRTWQGTGGPVSKIPGAGKVMARVRTK